MAAQHRSSPQLRDAPHYPEDGIGSGDAAELLSEFADGHREILERGDDEDEGNRQKDPPWWKKPSPLFVLCVALIASTGQVATVAPKIELYTMLVCHAQRPDVLEGGSVTFGASQIPMTPTAPSLLHSLVQTVGNDRDPGSCATDPAVQAAVAEISAIITATMGVVSLLTTAWWGSLSDRKGRVLVMGVSLIGQLVSELNYINVYQFSKYLPGGYWFLLVGPVIEGALGGFTTTLAAILAYLTDTTTEATRAEIFSLNLGLLSMGMALGPTIGSLVVKLTGKTISVFYASALVHIVCSAFIWLILPESLSRKKMRIAALKYEQESNEGPVVSNLGSTGAGLKLQVLKRLKTAFQFMRPLDIFFPDLRANPNPLKKPKRDWSLALLSLSYGFTCSPVAAYNYIFQYAAATFSWTSVQVGYYLTIIGVGEMVFLTVILPTIIKLFKPKPLIIDIPATLPSERDLLLTNDDLSADGTQPRSPRSPIRKELHSPRFELGVARVSMFVLLLSSVLMALAPTGPAFAAVGIVTAMGVGFTPAVQTCALAMYARKGGIETGRLFGALSVVQALSSNILGPFVYGLVYTKTVACFPRAIFLVSATLMIISLILFAFVRLPKDAELQREILAAYTFEDSETSIGTQDDRNESW